ALVARSTTSILSKNFARNVGPNSGRPGPNSGRPYSSACGFAAVRYPACFFDKYFMDYETPHPTSFLGHLLPKGEGRVFPTLSRGERVSAMCRRVRGQLTDFGCGRQAALRYPLQAILKS